MDVHHDLEAITEVAKHHAKEHGVNYNIIIHNPDENGEFQDGSTYEFVADSYFEKERPNVKLLHKTDDLLADEIQPPDVKELEMELMGNSARGKTTFIPPESFKEVREMSELVSQMGMGGSFGTKHEPYVNPLPKIGRNEPCPCGSGKKYKKCCI